MSSSSGLNRNNGVSCHNNDESAKLTKNQSLAPQTQLRQQLQSRNVIVVSRLDKDELKRQSLNLSDDEDEREENVNHVTSATTTTTRQQQQQQQQIDIGELDCSSSISPIGTSPLLSCTPSPSSSSILPSFLQSEETIEVQPEQEQHLTYSMKRKSNSYPALPITNSSSGFNLGAEDDDDDDEDDNDAKYDGNSEKNQNNNNSKDRKKKKVAKNSGKARLRRLSKSELSGLIQAHKRKYSSRAGHSAVPQQLLLQYQQQQQHHFSQNNNNHYRHSLTSSSNTYNTNLNIPSYNGNGSSSNQTANTSSSNGGVYSNNTMSSNSISSCRSNNGTTSVTKSSRTNPSESNSIMTPISPLNETDSSYHDDSLSTDYETIDGDIHGDGASLDGNGDDDSDGFGDHHELRPSQLTAANNNESGYSIIGNRSSSSSYNNRSSASSLNEEIGIVCRVINIDEDDEDITRKDMEDLLPEIRTRRHSRYVLEANKAHKKRPRSQLQFDGLSSATSQRRLTVHGSRLSQVFLNSRQSISVSPTKTAPSSSSSSGSRGSWGFGGDRSRSNSTNNVRLGTQKLVLRNTRSVYVLGLLPDELLFVLFTWMEPEDLGRIVSVCKRWMSIAELDILWETVSAHYYPEETSKALAQRLIEEQELFNQLNNQKPKRTLLQKFSKRASQDSGRRPTTFFKDIFVKAYIGDIALFKTGVWRNPNWKPKKSPWSKDDYLFVHNTLNTGKKNGSVPIKVVVVGDGAVGKTSLLCRYANNYFPERDFLPTIFDNFSTNTIYMNQMFNVSLWDTAGPEDYDRLRPLSYIGADIFLLCVDLVNAHSLDNGAQRWLDELTKHAPGVPILLCGTKMDLRIDKHYVKEARKKNSMVEPISFDLGCEVAKRIGAVAYAETSALSGRGVDRAFKYVMRYGCEYFLAQQKYANRKSTCGIS